MCDSHSCCAPATIQHQERHSDASTDYRPHNCSLNIDQLHDIFLIINYTGRAFEARPQIEYVFSS
jgi:hypothetical protein